MDEAGHIPDLSYTFDNILFPRTMGVGGQIHLFGTPKAHSDPYLLEVYEKGKDLFLSKGCTGCHAVEGWQENPRVGPELGRDHVRRRPAGVAARAGTRGSR